MSVFRNQAGQLVGTQMTDATSGADFTATVSVFVTGDAGTMVAGAGTVTHKGRGYHVYAPTQGETDYVVVDFTFTGTNAVPKTESLETEIVNV